MSANKQAVASADPFTFPADFMSGITSSSKPLKVVLGEVNCIYQYRLESSSRSVQTSPREPPPNTLVFPSELRCPEARKLPQQQKSRSKLQNPAAREDADDSSEKPDNSKGLQKRIRRRLAFLLIDQLEAEGVTVNMTNDYDTSRFTAAPITHSNIPGIWQVAFYDEDQEPDSPNLDHYNVIDPAETTDVRALLAQKEEAARANSHAISDALGALTNLPSLLNPFFSHCANAYSVRKQGEEPAVVTIGANKFYLVDGQIEGVENQPPWPLKSPHSDNPGGVVAYPGIFRSIRITIGSSMLLNINTATSAFYMAGNLQTVLDDFGSYRAPHAVATFVKGLRLRTTYFMVKLQLPATNIKPRERIYTAKGLPFENLKPVPSTVFFDCYDKAGNPIEISVAGYWSRPAMGQNARLNPNGYVIDCGKGVLIPAQYLEVLPGQPYKPKTEMVAQACRKPEKNYRMTIKHGLWLLVITTPDPSSPPINFSALNCQ